MISFHTCQLHLYCAAGQRDEQTAMSEKAEIPQKSRSRRAAGATMRGAGHLLRFFTKLTLVIVERYLVLRMKMGHGKLNHCLSHITLKTNLNRLVQFSLL